ncbi:MAG: hypothetical protein Tsb0021_18130 [Chlamydiales bacterium]
MFNLYPVDRYLQIQVLDKYAEKLISLPEEIEQLWKKKIEHNTHFEGDIFNVVEIEKDHISGYFIPYKFFWGLHSFPHHKALSFIKPLGISGFTKCKDKILIGKRSETVTQFPGYFEFAPSGSLSSEWRTGNIVDFSGCLINELEEETGITSSHVTELFPFILIEDVEKRVLDLCVEIQTDEKTERLIRTSSEYRELYWIEESGLAHDSSIDKWNPISLEIRSFIHPL